MWIVDPARRFKDGAYSVDYGIVGLVLHGYLLWRYIALNFTVQRTVERMPLIPDVVRTEVVVNWDDAKRAANQGAIEWVKKMYGWIDSPSHTGEAVVAELINLAKRADEFRKTFETNSSAHMTASMGSMNQSVASASRTIAALEFTKAASKVTLGVAATLTGSGAVFAAATLGKGAISGAEMKAGGASIGCTALNVGIDLALDFGKSAKSVGEGFAIVAKGLNKGAGAYMSGKHLPDAVIDGLVESGFQAAGAIAGSAATQNAVKAVLKKTRSDWIIPLTFRGPLPKDALAKLETIDEEVVKKVAKAVVKDGGKFLKDAAKTAAQNPTSKSVDVPASAVVLADAGKYEIMIRQAIYKVA